MLLILDQGNLVSLLEHITHMFKTQASIPDTTQHRENARIKKYLLSDSNRKNWVQNKLHSDSFSHGQINTHVPEAIK